MTAPAPHSNQADNKPSQQAEQLAGVALTRGAKHAHQLPLPGHAAHSLQHLPHLAPAASAAAATAEGSALLALGAICCSRCCPGGDGGTGGAAGAGASPAAPQRDGAGEVVKPEAARGDIAALTP